MDTWVFIAIAIAVVIVIALVALSGRRARQKKVEQRFGPEYERKVEETGSSQAAVSELREREKRRRALDIRPLDPAALERHQESWRRAQAHFVDHPGEAIRDADSLVQAVMRERGYPVEDFEQRAADISVDHPHVVGNYRAAHEIAASNEQGEATTEDLRQAMVHYRALFEELLEAGTSRAGRSEGAR